MPPSLKKKTSSVHRAASGAVPPRAPSSTASSPTSAPASRSVSGFAAAADTNVVRDMPQAPYARVKDYLKQGLASGQWMPGQQMPSESELVARFEVSRMTVGRALRELQAEGLVNRVQGVGSFAAHLSKVSSTLTIRDLHEEIEARGHQHHAQVVFSRPEAATPEVAAQLGLAPGASVFHSLLVHFENKLPLQCEDRYVNPACAPDYLNVDFTQITPTQYLLQVAPLWEAQYSIEAARPTAQEARLLGIDPKEPCLIVVRRTVNREQPITLARLVHPGVRYQIQGQFKP